MTIVAEGVETKEDWQLMESLGCNLIQGFYCSKALSPDDFLHLLTAWNNPHD